jgi:uncharacterized membrane protein
VALNNLGGVAGYVNSTGQFNYYLATYSAGQLSIHTNLGGLDPSAINDAGQIAGDLVFGYQMFLYSNGIVTPIGVLPGYGESATRGMNAAGDVIGVSIGATRQGFLYSNGQMQPIPAPAGVSSEVSALNNNGQIVGEYYLSSTSLLDRLFLYDHGQSRDLGSALGLSLEEDYASAINDSGVIVGDSETTTGAIAWAYFPGVGFSNLNNDIPSNTGWSLQGARDINAGGQIVGEGLLNGHEEGFLLTPVPEPASWASIGIALLAGLAYLGLKTLFKPLQKGLHTLRPSGRLMGESPLEEIAAGAVQLSGARQ